VPETEEATAVEKAAVKTDAGTDYAGDSGSAEADAADGANGAAPAEAAEDAAAEEEDDRPHNVIDAAARGASEGLKLALNIGAMLLAFVSRVALLHMGLGALGGLFGMDDLSFQKILGWIFSPLMFAVGVPWDEAVTAGGFLGQKLVLNEFVAFMDFAPQIPELSHKTVAVVTFAICGFANIGSMAVLLGGMGSLAPNQRKAIAGLGLRAILAGTLANLLSAAIAGILIG